LGWKREIIWRQKRLSKERRITSVAIEGDFSFAWTRDFQCSQASNFYRGIRKGHRVYTQPITT
jgi:hypothetical protein